MKAYFCLRILHVHKSVEFSKENTHQKLIMNLNLRTTAYVVLYCIIKV